MDSGSDSDPESLVEDHVNSDIDGEHVTIDFPKFQVTSFKDNQKSLDKPGLSLDSYKDDTSHPFVSFDKSDMPRYEFDFPETDNSLGEESHIDEHKKSTRLLQNIDNEVMSDNSATANGYVGSRPVNGTTNKTTQC